MKTTILKSLIVIVLSMTMSVGITYAQMGPVVSVSETEKSIPASIKTFINTYFPGTTMTEINLKNMDGIYSIDLSNGYELKFLNTGQWLEIEAPKGALISTEMIAKILPAESVEHLTHKGVLSRVNELSFKPNSGYKVEIEKAQDKEKCYFFDVEGKSITPPDKMYKDKRDKKRK